MMPRAAVPADIPGILALWNPVIRDTAITFNSIAKTETMLAEMLAEKARLGHGFLVAEQAGQILGFAHYGQFRAGIGYAHSMEHTILVASSVHGQGIGRSLMHALQTHARAGGAHSLYAGISAENPLGRAFHAAIGFQDLATLPRVGYKFGRWIDLHLMQKFLT